MVSKDVRTGYPLEMEVVDPTIQVLNPFTGLNSVIFRKSSKRLDLRLGFMEKKRISFLYSYCEV